MIKAAHSRFADAAFGIYLNIHMGLSFRKVTIIGTPPKKEGPVLLIGNHFSWWDGFIARHVNNRVLHKKLHLMMLEEELSKRRFLRKLGAFSIEKGNRSMLESFDYATNVLGSPNNLLVLFPQGRFQSVNQSPVSFQKGWFKIAEMAPKNTQWLFMASLVDYFRHPKPALSIYLHAPLPPENASQAQDDYNEFLAKSLQLQQTRLP